MSLSFSCTLYICCSIPLTLAYSTGRNSVGLEEEEERSRRGQGRRRRRVPLTDRTQQQSALLFSLENMLDTALQPTEEEEKI